MANEIQRRGEQDFPILPIAAATGLIVAAVEYPISQKYATVPSTSTATRMAIAGSMGFGAALLAGLIVRAAR
jgi:hypothetical protein